MSGAVVVTQQKWDGPTHTQNSVWIVGSMMPHTQDDMKGFISCLMELSEEGREGSQAGQKMGRESQESSLACCL